MILTLGLAVLGTVTFLALLSAGPATGRSRSRSASRRVAFVRAHPHHANSGDVFAAFAREGIGAERARTTLDTASARGVSVATLWQWIDRHGDGALALVAEAEQVGATARSGLVGAVARVSDTRSAATQRDLATSPRQDRPMFQDDASDDFVDDDWPDDRPDDWPAPEGATTRARVSLSDNVSRDGGRSSAA